MRFAPAAAALSLALALTASVSWGAQRDPSPRAAVLIAQGQASLDAGDTQAAIDAYEAALTVDPAYTPVLIRLAEAARQEQLQGKAIRYYREALTRDPGNIAAIAGEGEAAQSRQAGIAVRRGLLGNDQPRRLDRRWAARARADRRSGDAGRTGDAGQLKAERLPLLISDFPAMRSHAWR